MRKKTKSKPRNDTLRAIQLRQVKQLRSDARKLDAIAKHLRANAQEIADSIKAEDRAKQAQANFYSKRVNIDASIPIVPLLDTETE